MKIQLFKIRLSDDDLLMDQNKLDDFLVSNEIIKFESAFVNDKELFWSVLVYYETSQVVKKQVVKEPKPIKYSAENEELNADEIKILESLKLWRSEKARDQDVPVYFIASNKELLSVTKFRPMKKEELFEIKGFGKHKIENYGEEIIEILESI